MDQYQNLTDMEKQPTIKTLPNGNRTMPQLPVKALRKELFQSYKDCKSLWITLCKGAPDWKDEHLKKVFFRYIIEKKKDEPMYLNQTTTSIFAMKCDAPKCAPCWDTEDEDYDFDADNEEENNEDTTMNDQRNYLNNRVYQIAIEHEQKLRVAFHMNNDAAPETFDDLVARFKEGKVQLDKNLKSDRKFGYFGDLARYLVWRDPAVPADQAGYDAAEDKLSTARTNVLDDVAILEPKDALASVRAFETATFH